MVTVRNNFNFAEVTVIVYNKHNRLKNIVSVFKSCKKLISLCRIYDLEMQPAGRRFSVSMSLPYETIPYKETAMPQLS